MKNSLAPGLIRVDMSSLSYSFLGNFPGSFIGISGKKVYKLKPGSGSLIIKNRDAERSAGGGEGITGLVGVNSIIETNSPKRPKAAFLWKLAWLAGPKFAIVSWTVGKRPAIRQPAQGKVR
jgi:hypothetical protein